MDISANNFFAELIADTNEKFRESSIYHKQKTLNKKWNYAICATPITKDSGVIFGINWGGEDGYEAQTTMPTGQGITKYHFIQQSRQFLEKHWGLDITSVNFNYTNLCFFRSPSEKYLLKKDYELSLPLFEKYIRYINPPWLLSIGSSNLKVLDHFGLLKNIHRHFDNQNKFKGHSAQLWDYNIFSVPHPSAHLTNEARQTIWTKVTTEMKKIYK